MDSLSNNVEYVIFLTENKTTAVNDLLSNSVSVFPNPTSDNFNYNTEIDLSKNAKEIYFLKLKSQNEIITKKIIIE